jgi:hypothetical protein
MDGVTEHLAGMGNEYMQIDKKIGKPKVKSFQTLSAPKRNMCNNILCSMQG